MCCVAEHRQTVGFSQQSAVESPAPSAELTERDREILEFARQRWQYAGAKETAIRERFDMSLTRYHQVVDRLLDGPAAEAHDSQLVHRLRRLRDARRRQRSELTVAR